MGTSLDLQPIRRSLVSIVGSVVMLAACTSTEAGSGSGSGSSTGDGGAPTPGSSAALACPYNLGDCNQDPSDGCETNLVFDADNCGRCGRHCEDGECRDRTCTGTALITGQTAPFMSGDQYVVADGRVYFVATDSVDSAKSGKVWSITVDGGDAKMETDVDVVGFNVIGNTILASVVAAGRPAPAFDLLIVNRATGAKRTVVMDPEKNECVGTRFWRTKDEVISACVLPMRSFNGSQNTIVAIRPDGTLRRVFRRGCSSDKNDDQCWTGDPYGFRVSEGMMGWIHYEIGGNPIAWLLPASAEEETGPARYYYDLLIGPKASTVAGATNAFAFDGEHLIYEVEGGVGPYNQVANPTEAHRFGFEYLKENSPISVSASNFFVFESLQRTTDSLLTSVLGSDAWASYYLPCTPFTCKADEKRSILIMPWRPIDPATQERPRSLGGTPYYATGSGPTTAGNVTSDDRFVYWVNASITGGAFTLWRAPR